MDFISILPDEILHHIFSFLDGDDMLRCLGVSKRWRKLLNTTRIWRPICLKARISFPFPESEDRLPLCSWARTYFLSRSDPEKYRLMLQFKFIYKPTTGDYEDDPIRLFQTRSSWNKLHGRGSGGVD